MHDRRRLAVGAALLATVAGVALYAARGTEPEEPPPTDAAPVHHGCVEATQRGGSPPTDAWVDGSHRATVVSEATGECTRRYTLATDAPLRDGEPDNPRVVDEAESTPRLRTTNVMFDALYALAIDEARQASVDSIRDDAFDEGEPIDCPPGGCFETGRLWTYVWTRDTAYAADLGLAALDPRRARNSLEFKLSERRGGGGLQIVQDTGSGGSYPVSTDRVVWALGAAELMKHLDGESREEFGARTWEAVRNTVEQDRAVAWNASTGLYRGEQSFLDWREQSYPPWTAEDTAHIGTSQALSTNVAHLAALRLAAELAPQHGDDAAGSRYAEWADALATAIDAQLWLEEDGLWSTFTPTALDPAPARRFDLLGTALAVLEGVGGDAHARRAVASYPHLPKGPPVMWPQQKSVPIYHNRALWPFVTAYWARAARQVRNDAAVNAAVDSLVRGAALNLSHMENFEMVTGAPHVEEGDLSGPVVNSQRQLWSVAGYLSMVHDVLFGLETTGDGIRFQPYVTRALRNGLFAGADTLVLDGFYWRDNRLSVVLHLPPPGEGDGGAYRVGEILLDDRPVSEDFLQVTDLNDASRIDVRLVDAPEEAASITLVEDTTDPRMLFGPEPPVMKSVSLVGGSVRVRYDPGEAASEGLAYRVYRDGALVADALPPSTREWVDPDTTARSPSHCYAVEAYYEGSGNTSQRSLPGCWWGPANTRAQTFGPQAFEETSGEVRLEDGRSFLPDWGAADDTVALRFTAREPGEHVLRVVARNHAGPLNTGITCGVKRLEVRDAESNDLVAGGYVMMPHTPDDPLRAFLPSSPVRAELEAGRTYRVLVKHDPHAVNMSAFAHFERYTGGRGGREGPRNTVDLAAIEILARGAAAESVED